MFQLCGLWAIWRPSQQASLMEVKIWRDWKEKYGSRIGNRDKTRSSQVRLFRRGSNFEFVEELIEWRKVRQCASEKEERANSWCLHENCLKYRCCPVISPLGRDQETFYALYSKICKISVNRSVPDNRVTNFPTPPQICLLPSSSLWREFSSHGTAKLAHICDAFPGTTKTVTKDDKLNRA